MLVYCLLRLTLIVSKSHVKTITLYANGGRCSCASFGRVKEITIITKGKLKKAKHDPFCMVAL